MRSDEPKVGHIFKHWKGDRYIVTDAHTTWEPRKERAVYYRSLETGKTFVRPYDGAPRVNVGVEDYKPWMSDEGVPIGMKRFTQVD